MKIIESYLQAKNWDSIGLAIYPTKNDFTWNGRHLYKNSMLIDIQYINNSIQTEIIKLRFRAFALVRAL